jgi:hypothetical protein
LNRWCRLEGGLNLLFERTHLAAHLLDLPQQLLAGVRRVRREELEALPQERGGPVRRKNRSPRGRGERTWPTWRESDS